MAGAWDFQCICAESPLDTADFALQSQKMNWNLGCRKLAYVALLLAGNLATAGPSFDISQFNGRVLYLDFWASWCAPCQLSFPWMQSLQGTYASDGLAVVAVNLDRRRSDADRFLATKQTDIEVRFDPGGLIAEQFGVKGMPTSLIIDRHGVVRFTHVGFRAIDEPVYESQLKQILAEK